MSFLFPKAPSPPPPPKMPNPDDAMATAEREADLLRRRRGRASTILTMDYPGKMQQRPLKTLLGE